MDTLLLSQFLADRIPPAANAYCLALWSKCPFNFKLRKSRHTKAGDFTVRQGHIHRITVNEDLEPCLFLITYIHEVAHLAVHLQYGHRVVSHGPEWKHAFRQLMEPVMNESVFPATLLPHLLRHMKNPKASTFSDSLLMAAFRQIDERQKQVLLLSHIPEGSVFAFRGRWFKKGKLRRTRVACREIHSKANYLIPEEVPVEQAQLGLF